LIMLGRFVGSSPKTRQTGRAGVLASLASAFC